MHHQPIPVGDLAARRIVALGRLLATLGILALGSVDALPLPDWVVWAGGLVFGPWAAWLWIAEEGAPSRSRTRAAMAADLLAIATLLVVVADHAPTVLLLTLPLIAALTYQLGGIVGATFTAALVALRLAAWLLSSQSEVALGQELAILMTAALVIALLRRALDVQQRDAASVTRVMRKSDTILARSPESIVVTDRHGVILQANPAAERTLADGANRPLQGMSCRDRLGLRAENGRPLDCSTTCALVAMTAGDGQGTAVWREIGEGRQPLLASAAPIESPSGALEFVHSLRDITRIKQAEDAKTMFLATASHELKTPLTVIRGFTQVLQSTIEDDEAQVALAAIASRSAELAGIVDRLLLSSRIDAGHLEIRVNATDVAAALRNRLRNAHQSLGRMVDLRLDDDLVALTSADGLVTIVDHLLDNACKYSPGGPPIIVRGARTADEVVVEVIDRGIGMTPAQIDHCFDKFWQAEPTDVRRFGGTGIGLYIVRSIADTMGAEVRVDSAPGVGSTFAVHLPLPAPVSDEGGFGADEESPMLPADTGVDQFLQHLGITTGST